MNRIVLGGFNGASPLGFLGALGLLRILRSQHDSARLGFVSDGSFHPFIEGVENDLATLVAEDAAHANDEQAWRLTYEKTEKNGTKMVSDLKAPPSSFAHYLSESVGSWLKGDDEAAAYAAGFGTSVAVDGKGNTKPTAYHFTAANQQFLGIVEAIRASVDRDWAVQSLFEGHASRPGSNLRWDIAAERNWALMASNPNDKGTSVDAPLEWLAFRALPLLPSFPVGKRIITTGVAGWGDETTMTWPLWSLPASIATVRSLVQMRWSGTPQERAMRGVFSICTSPIRRMGQGFGNFGPAMVRS